jgi:hypothetical protein
MSFTTTLLAIQFSPITSMTKALVIYQFYVY